MNKTDTILREARGTILTRLDIDTLARKYHFEKFKLRKLLLNGGNLVTIFRGVYYLRNYEEKKLSYLKYSAYELLALGLHQKRVRWYFGLDTALKFLNVTHEVFPVNIVINDTFNRIKPMDIAGSKFLFLKLKPALFFGIKEIRTKNEIILFYSAMEKTILDILYLKKPVNLQEFKFNKSLLLQASIKYTRIVQKKIKELL